MWSRVCTDGDHRDQNLSGPTPSPARPSPAPSPPRRARSCCRPAKTLTAEVIASLKRKGVDHLVVEGDDGRCVRSAAEQLADLDVRFAGLEGNPLMMELKDLVAQQIAQGDSRGSC